MRRIIQRVVTVVTTTTWQISWETDPPHPSSSLMTTPAEDTASHEFPGSEVISDVQRRDALKAEQKEAEPSETGTAKNVPADDLPTDLNSSSLLKGNENHEH